MDKVKLLFLDIDSVLNASRYAESIYDEDFNCDRLVAASVPICKDNYQALKHIYENVPSLKVVWSTDWRLVDKPKWNGWSNPRLWLESQDWFKPLVIGKTPKKMSSTKPEELHMWFRDNIYSRKHKDREWMDKPWFDVCSYAIVDDWDSSLMYKFGKHFFKT